jgi:hypothetical protein
MNTHMKKSVYMILGCLMLMWSCTSQNHHPQNSLDEKQIQQWELFFLRYAFDPPKKVALPEALDQKYDAHYQKSLPHFSFNKWSKAERDTVYFEWRRRAPSFQDRWVATGGKMTVKDGEVLYYEEIYRTWKMDLAELEQKSDVLFLQMKKNQPLDIYYTQNTGKTDYIEFPNEQVYFDPQTRQWVVRNPHY